MTTSIMNTQVLFAPLTLVDPTTGAVVPVPSTDTFSVVSSGPASLAASIGTDPGGSGVMGVIGTPLVIESDAGNSGGGFTFTVSDSAGDLTLLLGPFDITIVPVVDQITAGAFTFTTQPAPTAPGP